MTTSQLYGNLLNQFAGTSYVTNGCTVSFGYDFSFATQQANQVIKPKKVVRTALDWLDERVNEIRVRL